MPLYVLYSTHHAVTPQSTTETIRVEEAFQAIQRQGNTNVDVARTLGLPALIGPRARITRTAQILSRDAKAAWLVEFPAATPGADPALVARFENDRLNRAADQLQFNLNRNGEGWSPPRLIAYDPRVHGDRAWWESGAAGNTTTRDQWNLNEQVGQTVNENPIGPNVGSGPPSLGEGGGLGTVLTTVAVIVVVGGLLYAVGPLVRAGSQAAADGLRAGK